MRTWFLAIQRICLMGRLHTSLMVATIAASACSISEPSICTAVKKGNVTQVEKLLNEGADPNTSCGSKNAEPVIVTAADRGHVEVAARLIARGAHVNARKQVSGSTALSRAACSDACRPVRARMVRLLLQAGADPNARDFHQNTPLMLACIASPPNTEVIRLLILAGAEVNAKNSMGDSALAMAVSEDNMELVKLLIRLGAKE